MSFLCRQSPLHTTSHIFTRAAAPLGRAQNGFYHGKGKSYGNRVSFSMRRYNTKLNRVHVLELAAFGSLTFNGRPSRQNCSVRSSKYLCLQRLVPSSRVWVLRVSVMLTNCQLGGHLFDVVMF